MRTEDDTMSVATTLGQEYEVPNLVERCPSDDGAARIGYASSHGSECALKARPPSPDSPLLWAGGQTPSPPIPSFHCMSRLRPEMTCVWFACKPLCAIDIVNRNGKPPVWHYLALCRCLSSNSALTDLCVVILSLSTAASTEQGTLQMS